MEWHTVVMIPKAENTMEARCSQCQGMIGILDRRQKWDGMKWMLLRGCIHMRA